MDVAMPPAFPLEDFRAFGVAASRFFPDLLSDEDLSDPLEKRRHFDWSWQAVRYRYRICAECNDDFKTLLANASESWRSGWGDEELNYRLERCIYIFFMSALSVFDSFGFALYFLGSVLRHSGFTDVSEPKNITLRATIKAYEATFPQAALTQQLRDLTQDPEFRTIAAFRVPLPKV